VTPMKKLAVLIALAVLALFYIFSIPPAPQPTPTPVPTLTSTPIPVPSWHPGEAISDTTSSATLHGPLCSNDSYLQSISPAWLYIEFYMPNKANATLYLFQDRAIRSANFTVSTISKAVYDHGTELDGVPEYSQITLFQASMENNGEYIAIPLGELEPENDHIYIRIGTPLSEHAVFQPCRVGSPYPPYLKFT